MSTTTIVATRQLLTISQKSSKHVTTIDASKSPRGLQQYLGIWCWLSMIFWYLCLIISIPFLIAFNCKVALSTICLLMVLGVLLPIDRKSQPTVSYNDRKHSF